MKIKKTKPAREKEGTKKRVTKKKKQLKNVTTDDFFNQKFGDEMNDDTNEQGNSAQKKELNGINNIFIWFWSKIETRCRSKQTLIKKAYLILEQW